MTENQDTLLLFREAAKQEPAFLFLLKQRHTTWHTRFYCLNYQGVFCASSQKAHCIHIPKPLPVWYLPAPKIRSTQKKEKTASGGFLCQYFVAESQIYTFYEFCTVGQNGNSISHFNPDEAPTTALQPQDCFHIAVRFCAPEILEPEEERSKVLQIEGVRRHCCHCSLHPYESICGAGIMKGITFLQFYPCKYFPSIMLIVG